jgi:CheY-like chemotaxis protein
MSGHSLHRILVIDDSPAIHQDFRKILCTDRYCSSELEAIGNSLFGESNSLGKQYRFEIDSAFQGHEGLARVHHAMQEGRPYEMAFLDVRMPPGLDGIEVTPMLWKADPNLEIVICTAYSDYSWEQIFGKVGTSDRLFILKKPFDRVEVLQMAHALVERRRLHQEARINLHRLENAVEVQAKNLEQMSGMSQAQIAKLKQSNQSPG